jgi:hypothetical protein
MTLTAGPVQTNSHQDTDGRDGRDFPGMLAHIGAQRQKARAASRHRSSLLAEMASEAHAAGVSKAEISRLAQISRPALDTMLHGRTPESEDARALKHARDLHRAAARLLGDVYHATRLGHTNQEEAR